MNDKSRVVEIQATYWISHEAKDSSSSDDVVIEPTRIQSFGTANLANNNHYTTVNTPLRIGLPEGVSPEKRPAGDESYSGLHDQGPLPPLNEGGSMAILITCLQDAKIFNDQYLTEVITAQKNVDAICKLSHNNGSETGPTNPLKKAKMEQSE